MGRFMKANVGDRVRVLNVLASGEVQAPHLKLDRQLVTGQRNASSLFDSIMNFGLGNELVMQLLDADADLHLHSTRVSTHPGFLKTDLHRGQGFWFDVAEWIAVGLFGVTIEESGFRQASILASPKLKPGQMTYVSSDMIGRLVHPNLREVADDNLPWLKDYLHELVDQ